MSQTRHDLMATSSQDRAPGSHIERHRHPMHQIVYPSTGAVSVTTPAGTWITPASRAIWIPAGHWHRHSFHGRTRFHCVAFDPTAHTDQPTEPAVVTVSPLVRELLIECSSAVDTDDERHRRMLTVLADQLEHTDEVPLRVPAPSDRRLRAACAAVEHHLDTPMTLADVGRHVGLGERTLSRLFRDDIGMTYPQWRNHIRLLHALRLLAEDELGVTSIAYRCGWSSPSAFIDTYRQMFGDTPGNRMRRHRAGD